MAIPEFLKQADTHVTIVPSGTLGRIGEAAELSAGQAAAVEEIGDAVNEWLAASPDHAAALVSDPRAALSEALGGEDPPEAAVDLLTAQDDEPSVPLTNASLSFASEPAPPPTDAPGGVAAALKTPAADNHVTVMLNLGAVSRVLQAEVGEGLGEFLGAGPLALPGLDLGLALDPRSTTPVLTMQDSVVSLAMRFAAHLVIGELSKQLDDIVVTVPITAQTTSASEGLSLRLVPDGAPEFASPAGSDGSGPSSQDVVGLLPDLDDVLDDAADEVAQTLPDADDIRDAVNTVLTDELVERLAMVVDVPQSELLCGLRPSALGAGFVPGGGGHQAALAIGLNYAEQGEAADDVELPSSSQVAHGLESWVELSNALLLDVVCCLVGEGIPELPDEPTTRTPTTCGWEEKVDLLDEDGKQWTLHHVQVTCAEGIGLEARLSRGGTGWRAVVTVNLEIEVVGGPQLFEVHSTVDVDVHKEWWVKLLIVLAVVGAVVGVVVGGVVGAFTAAALLNALVAGGLVGGAVGVGLALAVNAVIWGLVEAIAGSLMPAGLTDLLDDPPSLLPEAITDLFQIDSHAASWDDLEVEGVVRGPGEPPLAARGNAVLVSVGDGINLDTGELVAGTELADTLTTDLVHDRGQVATLEAVAAAPAEGSPSTGLGRAVAARAAGAVSVGPIRPGPALGPRFQARGTARLVSLPDLTLDEVVFADVRAIDFPDRAAAQVIPNETGGGDSPAARVFAVRTTGGNFARCAVWRDAEGRARLRFRTWQTLPSFVDFEVRRTTSSKGKPETGVLLGMELTATARPSSNWPEAAERASVRWFVDGQRRSGQQQLASGVNATFSGDTARIDVEEGSDFDGVLGAVVEGPDGMAVTVSTRVLHKGRLEPGAPDGPGGPGGPGVPDGPRGPGGPGRPGGPPGGPAPL